MYEHNLETQKDLEDKLNFKLNLRDKIFEMLGEYQITQRKESISNNNDFEICDQTEEEDFISIDGGYKKLHTYSLQLKNESLDKPSIEGLSDHEWAHFKFGGCEISEDYNRMALLDSSGIFNILDFNDRISQWSPFSKLNPKDYNCKWKINHFDLFEKGNLLISYEQSESVFSIFNLQKQKKIDCKINDLEKKSFVKRWKNENVLTINRDKNTILIYDLHKKKLKRQITNNFVKDFFISAIDYKISQSSIPLTNILMEKKSNVIDNIIFFGGSNQSIMSSDPRDKNINKLFSNENSKHIKNIKLFGEFGISIADDEIISLYDIRKPSFMSMIVYNKQKHHENNFEEIQNVEFNDQLFKIENEINSKIK